MKSHVHVQPLINIRLATGDDLARIQQITDVAYAKYIARLGRKPQPMTAEYLPMITAQQVWLAQVDAEIAGLIVLPSQSGHLLIYSVAVHPDWQGQGVGHRLLAWAEAEAHRLGYVTLQLYTNEKMTENIALYTQIGYREIRRETYKGLNVIYMEKVLRSEGAT
jgi:GNAT superfamily N-acetyltransferase